MGAGGLNGADSRCRRRWTFAGCVFDEGNWTLSVGRRRVSIETKPLELLRELLLRAGNVVSKDELLDTVWPDVTVVEASLPTAVHKLRLALGNRRIIETVPAIGYRLAVTVETEDLTDVPVPPVATMRPIANDAGTLAAMAATISDRRNSRSVSRLAPIVGLLLVAAVAFAVLAPSQDVAATATAPGFSQRDAARALRSLDIDRIDKMLAAGWDPNRPFDTEGNAALHTLMGMCEWSPDHDRAKFVLMMRTLEEGGARLDLRNKWGDTPYSIAKAPRYCGPDHPATRSMKAACFNNPAFNSLQNRCLATYELKRMQARRTARHALG